jgi:hypothetical protein
MTFHLLFVHAGLVVPSPAAQRSARLAGQAAPSVAAISPQPTGFATAIKRGGIPRANSTGNMEMPEAGLTDGLLTGAIPVSQLLHVVLRHRYLVVTGSITLTTMFLL